MELKNLKDERFGRLTVVFLAGRGSGGQAVWLCKCICGTEKKVLAGNLGKSVNSCGCLRKDQKRQQLSTHRMSKTRIYRVWGHMLERCSDLSNPNYGGKGIKVCKRWLRFENFYADMGDPPFKGATLDRYPDKQGSYKPGNVRWATWKQQERNRSNNRLVTFRGQTLCVSAWAERLGLHRATLRARLDAGWPLDKALSPKKWKSWAV